MTKRIRKAVFPVAGLGTRFLPATKSVPKEMLTVVDRPVVQHVVDEAREAGIEHFVFVTGRGKGTIEDHFDMAYELEDTLSRRGKTSDLEQVRSITHLGQFSYVRQGEPLGLGHAVLCARHAGGNSQCCQIAWFEANIAQRWYALTSISLKLALAEILYICPRE